MADQLHGVSELIGLRHSPARLRELEAQVTQLFGSFTRLEGVDVTTVEMALVYLRPTSPATPDSAV